MIVSPVAATVETNHDLKTRRLLRVNPPAATVHDCPYAPTFTCSKSLYPGYLPWSAQVVASLFILMGRREFLVKAKSGYRRPLVPPS